MKQTSRHVDGALAETLDDERRLTGQSRVL
jgi:hypothetical protein